MNTRTRKELRHIDYSRREIPTNFPKETLTETIYWENLTQMI